MNKFNCHVNSHIFTFSAFSPKFVKLFGKVSFRRNCFTAKWFSAKCRASEWNSSMLSKK